MLLLESNARLTLEQALSNAQLVGYLALALGIASFSQKDDRRLKVLLTSASSAYVIHFWLLGQPAASTSAGVAAVRTLSTVKTRSGWVCALFLVLGVSLGLWVATGPRAAFPILATTVGTISLFTLSGLKLRLGLLTATLLWLVNNLLAGSIGGSLLESCVAVANLNTIRRLAGEAKAAREGSAG